MSFPCSPPTHPLQPDFASSGWRRNLLMACLACSMILADKAIAAGDVPGVEVNQVSVNGIKLNSDENQIYKTLGAPGKVIKRGVSEAVGDEAKDIYYSGLRIHLIAGQIHGLECQGSLCVTDKAIRIGDTREKVERAYGTPPHGETSGSRIDYPFRIDKQFIDSSLVFILDNDGKVVKILYHVDYT